MNKEAWLKFIRHSTEAHHLREIFNGTFAMIELENVQKLFFDRIDHLLTLRIDASSRKALEDLREDIEDEIEFGEMRNNNKVPMKPSGRPYESELSVRMAAMIDKIRNQLDEMEDMMETTAHVKVTQE